MSVVVTKNPSGLKMRFECGKDELTGKLKMRNKTYPNVKADATDEDVHAVGLALASLQANNLVEIAKIDNSTLSL